MQDAYLECLAHKAHEELLLHVDIAGEGGGEDGPVQEKVDHGALEVVALVVDLLAPEASEKITSHSLMPQNLYFFYPDQLIKFCSLNCFVNA